MNTRLKECERVLISVASFLLLILAACSSQNGQIRRIDSPAREAPSEQKLIARVFNSGFERAHDTYNGISVASDGKVYYVLCSESVDVGAQMYSYDPAANRIRHLGDLTEACGEKGLKAIPQGKSHVSFYESLGKLYFSTHIGYYTIMDGMESMGVPPPGYKPYPGGHFLRYDMASGRFEELAAAPNGEGILTTTMDRERNRLYGLTWPTGYFLRYDITTDQMKNLGPISGQGEKGRGPNHRTLCRSFVADPRDGSVYFTIPEGDIFRYRHDRDSIERVPDVDLRKDYFGQYDPASLHMAYNWRQTVWNPVQKVVYGVHGRSGYLFRFDPAKREVNLIERLTSLTSKRSGMFDQFSYGYLGFTLGPDQETVFYLTGGAIDRGNKRPLDQARVAPGEPKVVENLHLITYHIPSGRYRDHGPIFFENGDRPSYVSSIAVARNGTVYALSRITENGRTRTDLISLRVLHAGQSGVKAGQ